MDTLNKGQKNDVFVPETIEQEAYLLLLIADTLHEYVIDRAPEHDKVCRFCCLSIGRRVK